MSLLRSHFDLKEILLVLAYDSSRVTTGRREVRREEGNTRMRRGKRWRDPSTNVFDPLNFRLLTRRGWTLGVVGQTGTGSER